MNQTRLPRRTFLKSTALAAGGLSRSALFAAAEGESIGDLLVIWNNVASKSNWPRTPLTAAISRDEGRTWTHFRDVDNRPDYDAAYPSVTFVGDEALVAYYSRSTRWKRDAEITLKIYRVDQFYT